MQKWKLIGDSAQFSPTEGDKASIANRDNVYSSASNVVIPDSGFASTSHPKLKFNFTADIVMRVPLEGENKFVAGADSMALMDIPVKTATRPNPTVSFTDINYYNYRTKVASKVDYGTVSVTFYDDGDGKAHRIYSTYLERLSPIANTGADRSLIDSPYDKPFGQMSSIGPLPNNPNGLIQTLSVYHYYTSGGLVYRMQYMYINPKIQTFELDELSMSESDVDTITMVFTYDGVSQTETTVD